MLSERGIVFADVFFKMWEGCVSIQEATEPQTGNISKVLTTPLSMLDVGYRRNLIMSIKQLRDKE